MPRFAAIQRFVFPCPSQMDHRLNRIGLAVSSQDSHVQEQAVRQGDPARGSTKNYCLSITPPTGSSLEFGETTVRPSSDKLSLAQQVNKHLTLTPPPKKKRKNNIYSILSPFRASFARAELASISRGASRASCGGTHAPRHQTLDFGFGSHRRCHFLPIQCISRRR